MTAKPSNNSSSTNKKSRRQERRKLADLKPHPQQVHIFGDVPEHRLEQLAASIDSRGMDHLPEILPNGTILKGHQRLRVEEQRGETEADVIVRYDLADDPGRAGREFLEDNLLARQLSRMQTARGYIALLEVYEEESRDLSTSETRRRVHPLTQLASVLDKSEKTVNRYIDATKAPIEVQDAFDRGEVKLEHAARVGRLPSEEQEQIAEAIRAGEEPKEVVADYVVEPVKPEDAAGRKFQGLMQAIDDALALAGQPLPAGVIDGEPELETLKKGQQLIDEFQKRIEQLIETREENVANVCEEITELPSGNMDRRVPTL